MIKNYPKIIQFIIFSASRIHYKLVGTKNLCLFMLKTFSNYMLREKFFLVFNKKTLNIRQKC